MDQWKQKMYILARSEKHVNRMQLCFSRIGLYYQRSMDFWLPNDIVLENYDLAFDSKSDKVISIEQLQKQMVDKSLLQFDEIVLLAGKKHKKVVTKLYPEEMITYPLEGCKGIGYMLQRLKEAVKEEEEI